MKKVDIKSYGKINLVLDCLYKRNDGYHEVAMIMQAISLHDLVTLKKGQQIEIDSNHPLVPKDHTNLAYQAAQLVKERYPKMVGVEIFIEKNIPVEAGLAGGSSNGASVILGLNRLYDLAMDKKEMLEMAAKLGSDVSFFLEGPTSLATGRGELITPLNPCPQLGIVLVKPEFGVRTPEVYKNLDLQNINNHPDLKGYIKALEKGDIPYLVENLYNALETSTFNLYPPVKGIKNLLINLGANYTLMSGSGPTIFSLFPSLEEAQAFAHRLSGLGQIIVCSTIDQKLYQERIGENAL